MRCAFVFAVYLAGALALPGVSIGQTSRPAAFPAGRVDVLDINMATLSELAALPGMGPVYARRIVSGRPYTAKNQLVTRGILPKAAYEQIRDRVVAHRPK